MIKLVASDICRSLGESGYVLGLNMGFPPVSSAWGKNWSPVGLFQ